MTHVSEVSAASKAWAAGILEGEGCFCVVEGKYPKIVVQMNDQDIILRLQEVFKCGAIYRRPPRGTSKESWQWNVYRKKEVLTIIEQTKEWYGKRRSSKIKEFMNIFGEEQ